MFLTLVIALLAVAPATASGGSRRLLRGTGLAGSLAGMPSVLPSLWATAAAPAAAHEAHTHTGQLPRGRPSRRLLATWGHSASAHVAPGAVGAPAYRPPKHTPPQPHPAPAPSSADSLPDVILPETLSDASALLRSFVDMHQPQPGGGVKVCLLLCKNVSPKQLFLEKCVVRMMLGFGLRIGLGTLPTPFWTSSTPLRPRRPPGGRSMTHSSASATKSKR